MKKTILLSFLMLPSVLHASDEIIQCKTQKVCTIDGTCEANEKELSLVILNDMPRYLHDIASGSLVEIIASKETMTAYWEQNRTHNTLIFSSKDIVWVQENRRDDETVFVARLDCGE